MGISMPYQMEQELTWGIMLWRTMNLKDITQV